MFRNSLPGVKLNFTSFGLTYGEAWLLETAVEGTVPFCFLALTDRQIAWQFNHASHHMTREELLGTLCAMFARGDLIAHQEVFGEHIPTRDQIEQAIVPPTRLPNGGVAWGSGADGPLCYGITQAGGARWEQMAEPNWERYYQTLSDEEETEMSAGSQQRLEELLANMLELWDMQVEGEIERDVMIPWEATYWKTLATGYRARFRYQFTYSADRPPRSNYRRLLRWRRTLWDRPEGTSAD